ncbi:hypothetical protein JCM5353_007278 [Sporobolomyces roseus]
MNPTCTSPLGPIHCSHPSQSPSFVLPLPSSSRLRSIFRPSSSSKPPQTKKDKKQPKIEIEWFETKENTFTPLENASPPPPPYRQAIEEDLYCEDVEVTMSEKERKKQEKLERRRRALIEADKRMSEASKSFGI